LAAAAGAGRAAPRGVRERAAVPGAVRRGRGARRPADPRAVRDERDAHERQQPVRRRAPARDGGFPLPGVELRLADGTDEVHLRGPNVLREYWNRPDATADAFDGDWFRSGDIGAF